MAEYMMTGVGGEPTDQSFTSAVGMGRPLWRLKPLPLSQVNPDAADPMPEFGPANSLRSACLSVISRGFHHYRADSIQSLPSHLVRQVMARVNSDRGYGGNSELSPRRPDEATMWAYHALADPDSVERKHTLILPADITMAHLRKSTTWVDEPDHPLNALPPLFDNSSFAFLTTLTLQGTDGAVNDTSIQSLKWCTHLTGLWMRRCNKVTDDGIRLLASSMDLPSKYESGRGMWRLRAWWLRGCRQISDKSMKSFAKWPGLMVLGKFVRYTELTPDLRDTSCTTSGIDIFNRVSQTIFADRQPPFQPTTRELRPLFSVYADPDEIIYDLSLSLMKDEIPWTEGEPRKYLAFHLLTGTQLPKGKWLHEPLTRRSNTPAGTENKGKYVRGVGYVYGNGASSIGDEDQERQDKVKRALRYESHKDEVQRAEEEGLPKPKSWYAKEAEARRNGGGGKGGKRNWRDWTFEERMEFMNNRREADVTMREGKGEGQGKTDNEFIRGHPKLMLVRMVNPQWQELKWQRAVADNSVVPVKVTRKARVTADAFELLGMTGSQSAPLQAPKLSQPSSEPPSSSPLSDRITTPSSSPATQTGAWAARKAEPGSSPFASQPASAVKRNPFAPTSKPTFGGLRGLSKEKARPIASSAPVAVARDPLAFVRRDVKPLVKPKEIEEIDSLDFKSSNKRAWGSLGKEEVKRKNMKLFAKQK